MLGYVKLDTIYEKDTANESGEPHALRFLSITLQNTTATTVLTAVATMAGPTTAVGFPLPYWLLYAMILTGISCREEILIIKNVHISLLAVPLDAERIRHPFFAGTALALPALRSSSSCARLSIAFSPAGVAAQPRPRKLAGVKIGLKKFLTF